MLLSVDPRPFMANPLELSLSDSFNRERFTRIINESSDVKELRQIAVLLLGSWLTQKAATQWILKEAMSKPFAVSPETVNLPVPQVK